AIGPELASDTLARRLSDLGGELAVLSLGHDLDFLCSSRARSQGSGRAWLWGRRVGASWSDADRLAADGPVETAGVYLPGATTPSLRQLCSCERAPMRATGSRSALHFLAAAAGLLEAGRPQLTARGTLAELGSGVGA